MAADPVTAPLYPAACPSCGAAVRSDVAWCTLCYASLLPQPEPEPEPEPEVEPEQAAGVAPPQPDEPDEPAAPDVVVQRLLAELAATRDPQPAWMSRLPQGRAGKAIVMIAGGTVASLLLLAVMALIGLFL